MKKYICKYCGREFSRRCSHNCNGVSRKGGCLIDSDNDCIPLHLYPKGPEIDIRIQELENLLYKCAEEQVIGGKHYYSQDGCGAIIVQTGEVFCIPEDAFHDTMKWLADEHRVVNDVRITCSPIRLTSEFPLPTQKVTIEFEYCPVTKDGGFNIMERKLKEYGYYEQQ